MKTKAAKKPKPLRGDALLRAVVNQIIETPMRWEQAVVHCGTSHCVGGWAQVLAGRERHVVKNEGGSHITYTPDHDFDDLGDAQKLLRLNDDDANYLFASGRTFAEIYEFAARRLGKLKSPADYDPL